MISTLLLAAVLFQVGQPQSEPTAPQPIATEKPLPWPGPDVRFAGMKLAREEARKLLNAKSIYMQIALPPEEATPPKWLTQRWSVTGPSEADLLIFISKQSSPGAIDCSFASWSDVLNRPVCAQQPIPVFKSAVWYRVIVTDRDGNWVMNANGYDSLEEMWGNMYIEIQDRSRWEAKQTKKIAKEKKKASTQ